MGHVSFPQVGEDCHNKITVSALKMYVNQVLKQGKVINEELDHLLERVGSRNGQPQDITKGISLAVMNVICALVFGSKYGINDPEVVRFLEMTKGVVKTLSSGSVVDVFPWLSFIPFNAIKTLKQSCKEREELIGKIYWEHVEANRVQNPQDLTDAMLKAKMEAVKDNASIKELLTDKQLILTISEMFIAGMGAALPHSQSKNPRSVTSRVGSCYWTKSSARPQGREKPSPVASHNCRDLAPFDSWAVGDPS